MLKTEKRRYQWQSVSYSWIQWSCGECTHEIKNVKIYTFCFSSGTCNPHHTKLKMSFLLYERCGPTWRRITLWFCSITAISSFMTQIMQRSMIEASLPLMNLFLCGGFDSALELFFGLNLISINHVIFLMMAWRHPREASSLVLEVMMNIVFSYIFMCSIMGCFHEVIWLCWWLSNC